MKLSPAELADLASYYVAANTPPYLFRRLRGHSAVQRLATENSVVELIQEFHNALGTPQGDRVIATTYAYALLVAMTLKDYPASLEALSRAGPSRLDWQEALERIHRATAVPEHWTKLGGPSVEGGAGAPKLVPGGSNTHVWNPTETGQ